MRKSLIIGAIRPSVAFAITLVFISIVSCNGLKNTGLPSSSTNSSSSLASSILLNSSWTPEWGSIVAVWHLNETSPGTAPGGGDFWDATGNGHNGTITGNVTMGVSGVVSLAAGFDGSTSYVTMGNLGTLPSGLQPRTLCGWGSTSSLSSSFGWIASWGSVISGGATFIGRNGTFLDGGGYGNDIGVNNFWTLNTWHHICLTYDGTNAALYTDGVQAVAPTTIGWSTVPGLGYIGRQVNGSEYWAGSINEVAIWSTNLSSAEVSTIYTHQTQQ